MVLYFIFDYQQFFILMYLYTFRISTIWLEFSWKSGWSSLVVTRAAVGCRLLCVGVVCDMCVLLFRLLISRPILVTVRALLFCIAASVIAASITSHSNFLQYATRAMLHCMCSETGNVRFHSGLNDDHVFTVDYSCHSCNQCRMDESLSVSGSWNLEPHAWRNMHERRRFNQLSYNHVVSACKVS